MAPPELTDTAENITSPQLRCWVATEFTSKMVSLGGNRIQKWIRVKQFLFYQLFTFRKKYDITVAP